MNFSGWWFLGAVVLFVYAVIRTVRDRSRSCYAEPHIGKMLFSLIMVGVGLMVLSKERDMAAFAPYSERLQAAAVAAEIGACQKAGLSNPHWKESGGGKTPVRYTFACSDSRGVVIEVVPPMCNSQRFDCHLDISQLPRLLADCDIKN